MFNGIKGSGFAVAALMFASLSMTQPAFAENDAVTVEAGEGAQDRLLEALIMAQPGQTIRLGAGTFALTDGLSLDVDNVTVEGAGMEQTILSFKGQETGAEGFLITSDNVTLKGFAVEDAKGDAVKSKGADNIKFIGIRTEWTNGPDEKNGAYGLYPVESKNILIDGCVAIGASDAGIYVGQSSHIVVRNSIARYNVAGIEIENSFHADVYQNIATHNTGGILVFDLPGLPQVGGHTVRVFRNAITNNNTANFAPKGNIVAGVPAGTGVIIMANKNVHLFENVIGGNNSTNVLVSAYSRADSAAQDAAEQQAATASNDAFIPVPRDVFLYRNALGEAGTKPSGTIAALAPVIDGPMPSILWDGVTAYRDGDDMREVDVNLVIHENVGNTSFANFGFATTETDRTNPKVSMDISAHAGAIPDTVDVTFTGVQAE
ncbi:MAG: parallel beta-helix domain-containing protein [Alphaproteobacteria bacterium]